MKRKRGHKKVKPKKTPVVAANEASVNAVSPNTEANSGVNEIDKDERESGMAVDTPSSTGTDKPHNHANTKTDESVDKTAGKSIGRVKVKLRTSKTLDSQRSSSDAPTKSDTDKSSLQPGLEKQTVVPEKVEDSANSTPEMKSVTGNPSKKTGSIKIKSSKGLGSSINSNAPLAQGESSHKKETKITHRDHRHNKQELNSALTVIKKVMKMDAAEPFNVPVNPVALGIPDYFDVIDTPMDFGTICNNLEGGGKYMNSGDVFKDVQYIWENCFKYNNKGDYILDLMRRVKKFFMKYWTAAGLYSEQSKGSNGSESIQAENAEASNLGKVHGKDGQSKQAARKRQGFRRHKNDCLCAICILKRRRKEREENERIAKGQTGVSDSNPAQEFMQEENSFGESPCGEDISSDMEDSPEQNVDPGLEEKREEVKLEATKQQYSSPPVEEEMEEEDEDDEEDEDENETQNNGDSETPGQESNKQPGIGQQIDAEKEDTLSRLEADTAAIQQQKQKESKEKRRKDNMHDNLRFENPMLLGLCDKLFPQNRKSIWNGPHSLVQHQGSARVSSIDEAIQTFMK